MSEDCLYLNVWTEAASASERRPVIVWSHGGALTIGLGSALDGEALARKGAVVVAYDYRLGPFGFFSHPELTRESQLNASGNYGLMDLVAVLRWVQRNIAAFGGDPNRVTLMGQSGGGRLSRAVVERDASAIRPSTKAKNTTPRSATGTPANAPKRLEYASVQLNVALTSQKLA